MYTPFRTFTTAYPANRTFAVRILPKGARYGVTNSIEAIDTLVEFYDTSSANDGRNPLGTFTGGRYFLATLLAGIEKHGIEGSYPYGLDLHGGVDEWKIDAQTMREILEWLNEVDAQIILGTFGE